MARGVQKDYTQAADWYEKAANQGDAVAQATLGYMCWYGIGVERDRIAAMRWYRLAAAQGNPDAKQYLASLKPTTRTRYIELGLAVIGFFGAILFALASCELVLPGRKLRDWRQPFEALLSLIFFAYAGLSVYASAHAIEYLPFHNAFHLFKRMLAAAAVVIVATVVLPAKKKPLSSAAVEHK